jgi:hypothetical protein
LFAGQDISPKPAFVLGGIWEDYIPLSCINVAQPLVLAMLTHNRKHKSLDG